MGKYYTYRTLRVTRNTPTFQTPQSAECVISSDHVIRSNPLTWSFQLRLQAEFTNKLINSTRDTQHLKFRIVD